MPIDVRANAQFNLDSTWVVVAEDTENTTLNGASLKRAYVFKCCYCEGFLARGGLADFGDTLKKHHTTHVHKLNVLKKCGVGVGPTGMPTGGAPSEEDFKDAWRSAGKTDKITKRQATMQQCILEADLEEERRLVKRARTGCIMRDAAKEGTLLVRASVCTSRCETKSFIMGLVEERGSSAFDINKHTETIYQDYFDNNEQDLQKWKDTVEAIGIDAASNEVAAARMSKDTMHDNLLAIIRDRPHAHRRTARRPIDAIPHLHDLFESQIHGKKSIIQRIHRSPLMTQWYQTHCHALGMEGNPFADSTGLGASKHRHDSNVDPVGQFVITVKAIEKTAEQGSIHFRGEAVGDDCDSFLNARSAEQHVDMGMLADAMTETQLVVRIFDSEWHDQSEEVATLRHSRRRLRHLFVDRQPGCINSEISFTRAAMDHVQSGPHVLRIRGKIAKEYGGPSALPPVLISTCLGRFQAWLALSEAVIAAEYPDFDLIAAFLVFNLRVDRRYKKDDADQEFHNSCITRLAQVFKVPEDALTRQLYQLLGLAKQIQAHNGIMPKEALARALAILKKRGLASAVEKVLWRHICWHSTTSNNERDFALERRIMLHKGKATTKTRFRHLRLGTSPPETYSTDNLKRILGRAREIWVGKHQTPTRGRRNKSDARVGQTCVRVIAKNTKASWKRQRNAAIDKSALSSASAPIKIKGVPDYIPTAGSSAAAVASIQEEVKFNKQKYHARMIEAAQLGTLINSERSTQLMDATQIETAKQRKQDKARLSAQQNKQKQITGSLAPHRGTLLSKAIFVSINVGENEELNAKLVHVNRVTNIAEAQVVVSSTLLLDKMGQRLAWAVMLCGMTVVGPAVILKDTGGCRACLTCKAAIRVARRVFISNGFRNKNPGLVDIVTASARRKKAKWKIMDTVNEFNQFCPTNEKAKCNFVLKISGEDIPGINCDATHLTTKEFTRKIEYIDAVRTIGSNHSIGK